LSIYRIFSKDLGDVHVPVSRSFIGYLVCIYMFTYLIKWRKVITKPVETRAHFGAKENENMLHELK